MSTPEHPLRSVEATVADGVADGVSDAVSGDVSDVLDLNDTGENSDRAVAEEAGPKKILIVEDNELNLKLFCDLLQANGYDTVFTRNGRDVMELAFEQRPDLILMDIQLPEISGLDLTKCIKQDEELKAIPIIAVTAFAMKGDEEKIREGGCEAYIAKPISVAHFIETVKRFTERDESQDNDIDEDLPDGGE